MTISVADNYSAHEVRSDSLLTYFMEEKKHARQISRVTNNLTIFENVPTAINVIGEICLRIYTI